jgi:hypothetical protein
MKDMLELGESSKSIVMEGNEAAHHADQFADVAMWRLGYVGDLEHELPSDGAEEVYMQNF